MKLGLRVTAEVKRRLDASADANGRSQSQEAELRLEHSFFRQDLLVEVFTLGYGKELEGVLMLLGSVMLAAGYGHPPRLWAEDGWTDDPDAYDQAVQAATMVLEAARPDGAHSSNSSWGVYTATDLIKAVRGDAGAKKFYARDALRIRSLLGPTIAHRMKIRDDPRLPVTPPPPSPRSSATKARITRRKVKK